MAANLKYIDEPRLSFKDGVYDISNDEYHGSEGISRSQLMLLDKSPYHFWYKHLSGLSQPQEPTLPMVMGSLFHTLLLEPHMFSKEYCLLSKIDRRTAQGKEIYSNFIEENKGKIIISQEQFDKAMHMAELVKKHEIVSTLLDESVFEQSIFWTDKETGLQFKVRPDIWSQKMVVDVKTTQDASPNRFMSSAYKYGYYIQAGMIYEACKAIGKPFEMYVILAIEKDEPYVPSVFILDGDALQFGIDQFQNYKRKLKECFDSNKWPAYPVMELSVPKYAAVDGEEE